MKKQHHYDIIELHNNSLLTREKQEKK